MEVRAHFLFVELLGTIFVSSIQSSITFSSQILRAQFFFITFRDLGCPSPYAIGAQEAVHRWHTAIEASGVGTARSERVVDALRCVITLI